MHIIHVAPPILPDVLSSSGGAIQRRIMELAVRQARRGHRVHVYSPAVIDRTETRGAVPVSLFGVGNGSLRSQWHYQRRVRDAIRATAGGNSIIHCHSTPELAWLCRNVDIPIVMSYDEYHFRRGRATPLYWLIRLMLRCFDRLLPVSAYCADTSAAYWRLPKGLQTIIHNGVNLEQFRPDVASGHGLRQRLRLPSPLALYVGRLNRQKGTDVLIEATRLLHDRGSAVTVVAAGPLGQFHGTPTGERWDQLLVQAGGAYLGVVDESLLPSLYNAAHVFVMPTRHLEMFGMAVIEAQATGLSVVATDHGGLRETVGGDAGGTLVPVGDAAALADAIETACRGDGGAPGRALNREFASRFDWERICNDLDAVYSSLSADFRPHRSPSSAGTHGS